VPGTSSFGCVQAVFGGVLDQLEVQMATDLFWKYMELSTQNAVRREDPLTWLCLFFLVVPMTSVWHGLKSFSCFSDLFRDIACVYQCLSYLNIFDTFAWNLYESAINPREWCKLLKPFCIVTTCFNMFHSWLRWQKHNWPGQDDNGIINSGGIGQSEPQPFQGNQETFFLKKRTFSVPWQV